MKNDWEIRKLKDICEKGSSNVNIKDLAKLDGDFPIYGASGFIQNVNFYHQEKEYIGIIKDGSGIGRTMLLPAKSSVIGTLQYILPKEGNSIHFINYALQSLDLSKYKQGAAIPHIYFRDYGETELVVPPLEEQKRIVKILDEKFAQLETIKANAQSNLQNAKDLFQSQLTKAFSNTTWEKKRLGDICSKIVDGTHNSPPNTKEGDYQYITAKNIKLSGIDLSDITYVTKEIHESIYSRCNPEKGDVLLIKDGATTGIAVVNELDYQFSMLSSVALLKFDRNILDSYCLAYLLNSDETYKRFRAKMEGAAITRLTLVKIKDFEIPLPPLPEQKRIVKELDSLSEKVRQLQEIYTKQISNCDELKQVLLQKAFEGEL